MSDNPPVRVIYTENIKPAAATKTSRIDLTPWDLDMLSVQYIQKGLLFPTPAAAKSEGGMDAVVGRLKTSLSLSLVHFFPLAGRLASTASEDGKGSFIHLDCSDQGAEFTLAVADGVTMSDVLAPDSDIPGDLIRRFFPLEIAMDYDGHTVPLLAAQLTELADGIFLGCSMNHVAVDGSSFWHLFTAWAEICRDHVKGEGGGEVFGGDSGKSLDKIQISRPPVHDRWFIDGRTTPIRMPFSRPEEVMKSFGYPPELRGRLFHFSRKDMAALKGRANSSKYDNHSTGDGGGADGAATTNPITTISSFQALCALVWRAITRARRLPDDHPTSFVMSIDNRKRMHPPLPADYFGNSVYRVATTTTAGELLSHDLGWAALRLNRTIAVHTDTAIRDAVRAWTAAPVIRSPVMNKPVADVVFMTSSPRFPMYDGGDFGWGTPVAARCGVANKFDGKITAYPGREGGGSADLELTLAPETMAALEADNELIDVPSSVAAADKE